MILNTIICYNNSEEVIRYISSILEREKERISFSVVINKGTDKDLEELRRVSESLYPGKVFIYDPGKNLGYLNGMLYGYREYIKMHSRPDFIIMSNTDIEIPDIGIYQYLEEKYSNTTIGCIGPSIYVKHRNVYDNPVCKERRTKREVDKIIHIMSIPVLRGVYVNLSDIKNRFSRKEKTKSGYVYEVHGCFFVLTQPFIRTIEDVDYGALMYSEEAYISESIIKNGFKTYYDSEIEVIHLEHTVTKGLKGEGIAKHILKSMKVIKETFY